MGVFISYSHADADFVDKLSVEFIKNKIPMWRDKWELNVGDSLIEKVQEALQESDFLCLVLSKNFIESEWCKKELTSGLLRELEEKRVVVLPLLIEDCNLPIFLRGKVYADFKKSFENGFSELIKVLAPLISSNQGRTINDEYTTDWGIDWGYTDNNLFYIRIEAVHIYKRKDYSILSRLNFVASKKLTEYHNLFQKENLGWFNRETLLAFLYENQKLSDTSLVIEDNYPISQNIHISDKKGKDFEIELYCRRLGNDDGNNIVYHFQPMIEQIKLDRQSRTKQLSNEEKEIVKRIISSSS